MKDFRKFNVHALDRINPFNDESGKRVGIYIPGILKEFVKSAELEEFIAHASEEEIGFWISPFIEFSFHYVGTSVSRMTKKEAMEILVDWFPRKISIRKPEEAEEAIPELIAFWRFLKRENRLFYISSLLRSLERLQSRYSSKRNDPLRFGTTRSFFTTGKAAGFDMENEKEYAEFPLLSNTMRMDQYDGFETSFRWNGRENTIAMKRKEKKRR